MEFQVSVPGKVILHGEHSVVYGKAAVAAAINLRTEVRVEQSTLVVLDLKDFGQRFSWSLAEFNALGTLALGEAEITQPSEEILAALRATFELQSESKCHGSLLTFLFLYTAIAHKKNNGCYIPAELVVSSSLPIGAGLGSSAAYSVALCAALLRLFKAVPTSEGSPSEETLSLISQWAFQSEVILHGKPSGIDNSICTHGGALLFQKGAIQEINTSMPAYRILLVNTRVSRNTRALVALVRGRLERHPQVTTAIFEALDETAKQSWRILRDACQKPSAAGIGHTGSCSNNNNNNSSNSNSNSTHNRTPISRTDQQLCEAAGELISINQHLLNACGAGHPMLDRVVSLASAAGYAAKLTGAGGGGCAFVLLGVGKAGSDQQTDKASIDKVARLCTQLETEGLQCWQVDMGCPGVTFTS